MPRPPCIAIPFKKTAELDWVHPLRQYIAKTYQEDPDAYAEDCRILQRMRQDMRGASADDTGRDLIFRYYSHLESVGLRFWINEPDVKTTFKWTDVFTTETIQQHSLAFEKAGVLFNLAVAFGMHGATLFSNSATSDNELATVHMAGIYFQVAAERFHYINENFLHAPSLDLQQETVNVLSAIMLAQAQECALVKSRLEKKKDATLSKLAQQAGTMYSNTFDNVKAIIDTHQLPRGWLLLVEAKMRYYKAMAQYHVAHADQHKNRHGIAIARYSLAEQHAHEASKLVGQFSETFFSTTSMAEDLLPESVQGLQELVTKLAANIGEELKRATHDNDVIYSESVPKTDTLSPLEAASVVSNFDINKFYASEERSNVVGGELFSRLIPMAVHESSSMYSEEKAKMIRGEEDKVNLADGELQDALSFIKMPGSLKRFERPLMLQQGNGNRRSSISSIIADLADPGKATRNAADQVQSAERNHPLSEMRARVEGQRSRAMDSLNDFRRKLSEEQDASDQVLSDHASEPLFAGYQPSSRAASFYRDEIDENQKKLDDAEELDQSILDKYRNVLAPWLPALQAGSDGVASVTMEHLREIKLEEVTSAAAAAGGGGGNGESLVDIGEDQPVGLSGHVEAIKGIYEQLLDLKNTRRSILRDLKNASQDDDISDSLIKTTTNAKDLHALFAHELKKYDPYTQRLQTAISKQTTLLKRISEEFRRLMELPQARIITDKWDMAESKKSQVESQLLEMVQVYNHVSDGLDKANRFYSMLNDSLAQFHRKLMDFVSERARERDQLTKQAMQNAAARSQAALKERLNQYGPPPTVAATQHGQQRRSYHQDQQQQQQPQQQVSSVSYGGGSSGYHHPVYSPTVTGAQAFEVDHLANQAAQISLSSPPVYPHGGSGPSAPPAPPLPQQNNTYISGPSPQPPMQQRRQSYGNDSAQSYQQHQQRPLANVNVSSPSYPHNNHNYSHGGLGAPQQQDPYYGSSAYQQQHPVTTTAAAPHPHHHPSHDPRYTTITNPASPSYKPGYGAHIPPTTVPLQSPPANLQPQPVPQHHYQQPQLPPATSAAGMHSGGYGMPPPDHTNVSVGGSQPAAYLSPPYQQQQHQQPQQHAPAQPVYGGNDYRPLSNGYAPPPYPPPSQQATQSQPTSYNSTVVSNSNNYPIQQQPPVTMPPSVQQVMVSGPIPPPPPQQQQQQPAYMMGSQPHQQQQQPSYMPQQYMAQPPPQIQQGSGYQQGYSQPPYPPQQQHQQPPPQQQQPNYSNYQYSSASAPVPQTMAYSDQNHAPQQQQQQMFQHGYGGNNGSLMD